MASLTPSHAPRAHAPSRAQPIARLLLPDPAVPSLICSRQFGPGLGVQGPRGQSCRPPPGQRRDRCQVARCHCPSGQQMAGQLATSSEHSGGLGAHRARACAWKPLAWQLARPWGGHGPWQGVSLLQAKSSQAGTPSVRTVCTVLEPRPAAARDRSQGHGVKGPGAHSRLTDMLPTLAGDSYLGGSSAGHSL